MKPKIDYIVLDEAQIIDGSLKYIVESHMFKNYEVNSVMSIRLVSLPFSYETEINAPYSNLTIKCDVSSKNVYDSTNQTYMATMTPSITFITPDYFVTPSELIHSSKIYCSLFNDITISVYSYDTMLSMTDTSTQLVLEIEYEY